MQQHKHWPVGHPDVAHGRTGVLLINLGTPDGTGYRSMRRYLKQFLSDRRVVDTSRLVWWPVLNGIILTTRPGRSGRAYQAIWNRERDESPLRTTTRAQAEKLAARLGPEIIVDWAMRYGTPAIGPRLAALKDRGADRVLLYPLYPQYAAATTASALDAAYDRLKAMRWQPAIRTVPPYHDDPGYIAALAGSVRTHLAGLDWEPEVILASFHGLPRRYLDLGDPYHCHCQKTVRLLRDRLGLDRERLQITFQSRFGPEEWLGPYTDETVAALATRGVRRLAVISPAFASDCVETLEELAIRASETFAGHGGEHFTVVPCLNDSEPGMELIETIARREMMGWL
jgi:ferrochelatase